MEEERRDTNDLNGEHMPQFGISLPCLQSNLDDRDGEKRSALSNHPLIERSALTRSRVIGTWESRSKATSQRCSHRRRESAACPEQTGSISPGLTQDGMFPKRVREND